MATSFDDGKEAGALRTIGEVCQALEIKAHVLRYWEQQFPTLKPLKRSGGRRYYRPEDIAMVERIDQLVNVEGYTLKGAKAALKNGNGLGNGADDKAAETSAAVASATNETAPHLIIGAKPATAPKAEGSLVQILPHLKSIQTRLQRALEA